MNETYDLVVIGGGTAGLVCAVGAAGLGARVALVERGRLGGECLNTGCVPSKALLRAARAVAEARAGAAVGIAATVSVDFGGVMAHVGRSIEHIAPHDSEERLASVGVQVFHGQASFASARDVRVGDRTLRFRRAVIATGSRPSIPDIEGLASTPFLTNENLFSIASPPASLAILGGGAVGCEMAQAFALLGTRVTLIEAGPRILPADDADAAAVLRDQLQQDGVAVLTGTQVTSVSRDGDSVVLAHGAGPVPADSVLVATGRTPNVDQLGLERAGVEHDEHGIRVDDYLRTTNPRVFASGDVCSRFRFTHAADAMSRIVVENALFFRRRRASRLVIPWCTFTMPEIAHVGIGAAEAQRTGASTITVSLEDIDRAVVDRDTAGFVRVHHVRGALRGVTIVAPRAGEMMGTVVTLMRCGGSLADLSAAVFPYPTTSAALRYAGDTFRRGLVTPRVRAAFRAWFRLLR